MKQTILFSILLLLSATAFSQDTGKDPYAMFGHKSSTKYETKVDELLYIKNRDTTSPIKSIAFDMTNRQVILLNNVDSTIGKIPIETTALLRWLSIDPKAKKYPSLSPYNFVNNNPINAIDPDGQDIVVLNNPNGASGYGHMAMLVGNDKTGWTFISKEGRDKTPWYSNEVTGGPALAPKIQTFTSLDAFKQAQGNDKDLGGYTQNVRFATDEKQDQTAASTTTDAAKSWYNVVFSNCADAVGDGLKKVGVDPGYVTKQVGIETETALPAAPNDRFKAIVTNNASIIIATFPATPTTTTPAPTSTPPAPAAPAAPAAPTPPKKPTS